MEPQGNSWMLAVARPGTGNLHIAWASWPGRSDVSFWFVAPCKSIAFLVTMWLNQVCPGAGLGHEAHGGTGSHKS